MDDIGTTHVAPTNLEQLRAWDGDEGQYWARHADQFDRAVAAYHERLLEAARIGPEERVLDVGCGTGQTTRDAARLATGGLALGIDLSAPMLAVARDRAAAEGVANVEHVQGDAQVHPFPEGGYDVAISRTGTMFFGDPAAGFANIARALRSGGRLAMAVWQPPTENEWFLAITSTLAAGRALPPPPPDAPSPFSLADPPRVRALLTGAGFTQPALEDLHAPMHFGDTAERAYDLVSGLMAWMVADLDEDTRRRTLEALHALLREHATADGVLFGSAMWLVTATRT
jgi:SAM-dependent methyltransferase